MSRLGLGLAWGLSLLTLVLPLPIEHEARSLSRTLLCAMPWIAASAVSAGTSEGVGVGRVLLYLLPLLAAACGLDGASGQAWPVVGRNAFMSLSCCMVLAWISSRACRLAWGGPHAFLVAMYLGVPLAWCLLPSRWEATGGGRGLSNWSPMTWCWDSLLVVREGGAVVSSGDLALVVSLIIFAGICRLGSAGRSLS